MQLRVARLCLDCEELHDAQMCPSCGSETFAYISRWIPAPERRQQPRRQEAVETRPEPVVPTNAVPSGAARWLRRGAVGMAAVAAVGWAWQQRRGAPSRRDESAKQRETPLPQE
jgi:predicted  nucleic acid-binding Zn-ribbon protein